MSKNIINTGVNLRRAACDVKRGKNKIDLVPEPRAKLQGIL